MEHRQGAHGVSSSYNYNDHNFVPFNLRDPLEPRMGTREQTLLRTVRFLLDFPGDEKMSVAKERVEMARDLLNQWGT